MILVGIAGPKRSGKNTLAAGLCAATGLKEVSFAGPLRTFVADILGITLDELEQRKEQPVDWLDGVTPRAMMQTVGTEWGRSTVHRDLWLRSLFARLPSGGGVISDVRFPNEAQAILDRGGVVLRLSREGTGTGDAHASEVPLPDSLVSHEIKNDGTPEDLVREALARVFASPKGSFGGFPPTTDAE